MALEAAAMAEKVLASGKYAHVSREVVTRLCGELLPRYKSEKEALKAVKKQLHIIHGAFFPEKCHERAMDILREGGLEARELSLQLMGLHPSTRERLPSLCAFYGLLSPYTSAAKTVLDIGCGFHPLAFPWMDLPNNVLYRAGDIDRKTADVVQAFFHRLGIGGAVGILDAAAEPAFEPADFAFLLKLAPVLEQQEKGLAYRLLGRLPAKKMAVTFPIRSLSGREKNMEQFYSSQFEALLPPALSILEKETVGTELVYILSR